MISRRHKETISVSLENAALQSSVFRSVGLPRCSIQYHSCLCFRELLLNYCDFVVSVAAKMVSVTMPFLEQRKLQKLAKPMSVLRIMGA